VHEKPRKVRIEIDSSRLPILGFSIRTKDDLFVFPVYMPPGDTKPFAYSGSAKAEELDEVGKSISIFKLGG